MICVRITTQVHQDLQRLYRAAQKCAGARCFKTKSALHTRAESIVPDISTLLKEFPGRRLYPSDPLEKAIGRLRVEKLSKVSGLFYKILLAQSKDDRQASWKTLHGVLEAKLKEI